MVSVDRGQHPKHHPPHHTDTSLTLTPYNTETNTMTRTSGRLTGGVGFPPREKRHQQFQGKSNLQINRHAAPMNSIAKQNQTQTNKTNKPEMQRIDKLFL